MVEPIGELIKQVREAAGDSPAKAADKVGISRQGYNKWEGGDTENMKLRHLVTFCDKYRVNMESLVRGKITYLDETPSESGAESASLGAANAYTQDRSATVLPTRERHPLYFKLDGYLPDQLDKALALLNAAEELGHPTTATETEAPSKTTDRTWTKLSPTGPQQSAGIEAEK